ncbi:MAG: HlyD family efflux transporter periplasmic adaptor subunit [Candidatus Cybelea sp.]
MRPAFIGGMDVARPRKGSLPHCLSIVGGTIALAAVALITLKSLAGLGGRGVAVDRTTIVTDVVQRGTLERSISAAGTLAPQEVHVVAATQVGIVDAVLVKPGASVVAGTPVTRMSNPELDAAVVAARAAVDVARAQLRNAQAQAQAASLAQRSAYTTALAQARVDRTDFETARGLHRNGFIAEQTYQIASIKAGESAAQADVARAQVGVSASAQAADVAAAQAQLDQASAQLVVRETEVEALLVRARTPGIVQSVAIDPGARVDAGGELARIADEHDLKAVLQVPEGQVPSIALGMPVLVDTGNGVATGRVSRVAPAAENGSVAVDVSFAGPLPDGARPDLNVDGTIEQQKLPEVLSIARPAGASDGETVQLYRIDPRTNTAHLVRVKLGRGSNDRIEVLSGLAAGDTVIVSDTSGYSGASLLHLH